MTNSEHDDRGTRRARADSFSDPGVAAAYRHRPSYPPALFNCLLEVTAGRARLLDLGCGTGKVCVKLAPHFERVDAVDPSAAMLAVAQASGPPRNIRWHERSAERFSGSAGYDPVTIGAAIHWLDHNRLRANLTRWLASAAQLAVVDGDGASDPPWQADWDRFLDVWLARAGEQRSRGTFAADMRAHETWLDITARHTFEHEVRQSIASFVACQHSRATWSRARLGDAASAFDAELTDLLQAHATDGLLRYTVRSTLTLGRPSGEM